MGFGVRGVQFGVWGVPTLHPKPYTLEVSLNPILYTSKRYLTTSHSTPPTLNPDLEVGIREAEQELGGEVGCLDGL